MNLVGIKDGVGSVSGYIVMSLEREKRRGLSNSVGILVCHILMI